MTVFMIQNKPHISASNSFIELSQQDYLMLLEHNEIKEIVEVELYD